MASQVSPTHDISAATDGLRLPGSTVLETNVRTVALLRREDPSVHELPRHNSTTVARLQWQLLKPLHVLCPILTNSSIGIISAWVSALCFSQGNVFSGRNAQTQSRTTFLVGVLVWVQVIYCGCIWVTRSSALFHLELVTRPGRPAGVRRILTRMFRLTISWFSFCMVIIIAIGYACGSLEPTWHQFKIELYATAVWNHSYVSAAEQAARRIYRMETVRGSQQLKNPQQTKRRGPDRQSTLNRLRPTKQSWQTFARSLPLFLALALPAVYVHVISVLGPLGSSWNVWIFTGGSICFKIITQEAAKVYILRKGIRNARTILVLVAVPTVLIDTQVRLVLLRLYSAQATVASSIVMAFVEVAMRLSKSALVRTQIWWKRRALSRHHQLQGTIISTKTADEEFRQWKTNLYHCFATELTADMYAEYLAIGCSSGIQYILGDHPHFQLGASTSSQSALFFAQFFLQIALEIVVDFASCWAEIASGVTFACTKSERTYYLVFFVTLALININLSAILYVK